MPYGGNFLAVGRFLAVMTSAEAVKPKCGGSISAVMPNDGNFSAVGSFSFFGGKDFGGGGKILNMAVNRRQLCRF